MNFTFDHLVHFVEKPDEAMAILKEKGIYAVEGGRHENRGTYNGLSYFDLSYIELLSTYDRELVKKTKHPQHSFLATVVNDQFVEGFSRIAVRTTDIEGAAQHFRDKGWIVNGPEPFSRKRPDGTVIEWQLLYVGDPEGGLELPFIIQWKESDKERRKELIGRNMIQPHPSGAVFSHVAFAVHELEKTVQKWSSLFGLTAGEMFIDESLGAQCQMLELRGGNLLFSSPIGDGMVSNILKKRGEKPFQVSFSGSQSSDVFELFGGIYKIG
ncbi:VOC family protein [Bacillus sp. B190/17]|uniref:VOC family protein n=1 Tax=Bacillus lumedeiriae TaxID=3058829 RepID=A0ABW8I8G8_9BACI